MADPPNSTLYEGLSVRKREKQEKKTQTPQPIRVRRTKPPSETSSGGTKLLP